MAIYGSQKTNKQKYPQETKPKNPQSMTKTLQLYLMWYFNTHHKERSASWNTINLQLAKGLNTTILNLNDPFP